MKKNQSGVTCKWNRFGNWNSCKRLPNFVNVAALVNNTIFSWNYLPNGLNISLGKYTLGR